MAREYNAINLGQGFPNFDCSLQLKQLVAKYLNKGMNQYCPMPGLFNLRNNIAQKITTLYKVEYNPESEITITAGATQALFTAITAFVNPGDEVIVFEPAYDSYIPSIKFAGAKPVPICLKAPDYNIDWNNFADQINEKTRMVIINTPQNPIGTIMANSDMSILAKILANKNIILLSDEVYEHLIYDDQKHHSALSYPSLRDKTIAVYSFGKTFHNTGWKIGYCVANKKLMNEFRNIHQWNVYCVNSFLQYALAEYMQDEESYTNLNSFYQEKRDYFNNLMKGSALNIIPAQGTYFQLLDYSQISNLNDLEFANWLCQKHGVASIPLSPFYTNGSNDKVVRLCFAKTKKTLEAAAAKLAAIKK